VKEVHLFALCTKMIDYTENIERSITRKKCTFMKLSKITFTTLPEEQYFDLTYGVETVTVLYQTRLFRELSSDLVFAESILSRIILYSLTYGIVSIDRHVTIITNEVLTSRHDCVFERYFCDYLD